jgi:hypothetical protein
VLEAVVVAVLVLAFLAVAVGAGFAVYRLWAGTDPQER